MLNTHASNIQSGDPTSARRLRQSLQATLAWSRQRDYAGYSKHDALNSPLLHAASLGVPFLRLALTQAVMRAPMNLRPLLGVPKGRNPKGIGLFAHAWLDYAETAESEDEKAAAVAEARRLLAWLVRHPSPQTPATADLQALFPEDDEARSHDQAGEPRLHGLGWGYHYPWQDQGFFQPRHFPNRVVTSWIAFAFLRAAETTGEDRYRRVCSEIVAFLLENPRALHESEDQLCLSYVPLDEIEWAVMDVSALVAAVLARCTAQGDVAGQRTSALRAQARRLMAFVVDKQTEYGAWFYTWPAADSHIRHDNYHTGIVLDCLADYMDFTGDHEWEESYRRGLDYYRDNLFMPDGAPRWMNDRTWPHDIHGAAAGILAFSRAAARGGAAAEENVRRADLVLDWTLRNLHDPRGFFYYRKTRLGVRRLCLMRWCNAWMCRAMAQRLRTRASQSPPIAGLTDQRIEHIR